MPTTVAHVLGTISSPQCARLPAPEYRCPSMREIKARARVAFAVPSMKDHMSDEGWQLMLGLKYSGYDLQGYQLGYGANVRQSLVAHTHGVGVAVVQDKREWDSVHNTLAIPNEHLHEVEALAEHPDIFKLTVVKDAHQSSEYHSKSASDIGCHAWIVYYHPKIVAHLAPYVRPEHLIRTYHSIDPESVPLYQGTGRSGCLMSGAVSSVYPLRREIIARRGELDDLVTLKHPGYHNHGSNTPQYLKKLTKFKVAICTSSHYGYALRKIVEATACGCRVITDLPVDDPLPAIDDNLVRVSSDNPKEQFEEIKELLPKLYASYDPDTQSKLALQARVRYSYRWLGSRLAHDIEMMRLSYGR